VARRSSPKSGWRSPGRIALVVGVVLFLLLDAILIGYALAPSDAGEGEEPAPVPTFQIGNRSEADPEPEATPAASPVVADPRFLVAVNESIGWRATPGSCPGGTAIIERTVDGGVTWLPTATNGLDSRQVLSLTSGSASTAQVVARSGEACDVDVFVSFTSGNFWGRYPDRITEFSYIDPNSAGTLQLAGASVDAPCEPRQVQEAADSIAVACDGAILERIGADTEWATLVVPGLLAIAPRGDGYVAAVTGAEGCAGLSIQSIPQLTANAAAETLSCIAEAATDQVTLTTASDSIWAWAGDRVWVSADGGASWA